MVYSIGDMHMQHPVMTLYHGLESSCEQTKLYSHCLRMHYHSSSLLLTNKSHHVQYTFLSSSRISKDALYLQIESRATIVSVVVDETYEMVCKDLYKGIGNMDIN